MPSFVHSHRARAQYTPAYISEWLDWPSCMKISYTRKRNKSLESKFLVRSQYSIFQSSMWRWFHCWYSLPLLNTPATTVNTVIPPLPATIATDAASNVVSLWFDSESLMCWFSFFVCLPRLNTHTCSCLCVHTHHLNEEYQKTREKFNVLKHFLNSIVFSTYRALQQLCCSILHIVLYVIFFFRLVFNRNLWSFFCWNFLLTV